MHKDNVETPPFWTVWNPDGRAASVKHTNIRDARTEAERLARGVPGSEFFVMQPVASFRRQDVAERWFATDDIPF